MTELPHHLPGTIFPALQKNTGVSEPTGPKIELQCVTKRFEGVSAADEISHCFAAGTTTAIAGYSGAGKSTLLRIIAGLEPMDGGNILLDGQDARKLPPAKRGIAYLNQDAALYTGHSLVRNLELSLKQLKLPSSELRQRITEALEILDLAGLEKRTPEQLSGGQRQRAALAKALARRAPVVLLDEPFSQLDVANRNRLRNYIRSIQESYHPTIILVSHDPLDAQLLAESLLIINDGKALQDGTPVDTYRDPRFLPSLELTSSLGLNKCVEPTLGFPATTARPLLFRPEEARISAPADTHSAAPNHPDGLRREPCRFLFKTLLGPYWLVDVELSNQSIAAIATLEAMEEIVASKSPIPGDALVLTVHEDRVWRADGDGSNRIAQASNTPS